MKRYSFALLIAGAGLATNAHALIDFQLDQNSWTIAAPTSGTAVLDLTGTVKLTGGWFATSAQIWFPQDQTTGHYLSGDWDASFLDWIFNHNTQNYSGGVWHFNIASNEAGLYDYAPGAPQGVPEVSVFGQNAAGTRGFSDSEIYQVEVTPTPEPASMAVLGVGVAALLRRRKKN